MAGGHHIIEVGLDSSHAGWRLDRALYSDYEDMVAELAASGVFYFQDRVAYNDAAMKFLTGEAASCLQAVADGIPSLQDYTKAGIEAFLRDIAVTRDMKLKVIAQSLRAALTGKTVSPGLDEVMITLGKERVAERIKQALTYIRKAR